MVNFYFSSLIIHFISKPPILLVLDYQLPSPAVAWISAGRGGTRPPRPPSHPNLLDWVLAGRGETQGPDSSSLCCTCHPVPWSKSTHLPPQFLCSSRDRARRGHCSDSPFPHLRPFLESPTNHPSPLCIEYNNYRHLQYEHIFSPFSYLFSRSSCLFV